MKIPKCHRLVLLLPLKYNLLTFLTSLVPCGLSCMKDSLSGYMSHPGYASSKHSLGDTVKEGFL